MAVKRKPSNSKLNFRLNASEASTTESKGKKPLPERTSVKHVFLMMIMHVCRKTIFVDTSIKVGIYGACLFLVSLVADVVTVPKSYFSRSNNVFNLYFVKIGWGWTLLVLIPFVVLTSYTYCCGKRELIVRHVLRLGVATFFWYFWTSIFAYIEGNYGRCSVSSKIHTTKLACLSQGGYWHSFDISGHAFILIYSCLVLIEEARAINGWESISDLIRDEEHCRAECLKNLKSPLKNLTDEEFDTLRELYPKFTPYIRTLFIVITCLTILWDVMLITTILYYHIMIEKFISGAIAILTWFFTYRYWYPLPNCLPNIPGDGLFKYTDVRRSKELPLKKKGQAAKNDTGGPKFMGMPIYNLRRSDVKEDEATEDI